MGQTIHQTPIVSKTLWHVQTDLHVLFTTAYHLILSGYLLVIIHCIEQIEELKRQAAEEKARIKQHPVNLAAEIESYSKGLVEKQKKIEKLQNKLGTKLRKTNIVDILTDHKACSKKVQAAESVSPGNCEILRPMSAAPTGKL